MNSTNKTKINKGPGRTASGMNKPRRLVDWYTMTVLLLAGSVVAVIIHTAGSASGAGSVAGVVGIIMHSCIK